MKQFFIVATGIACLAMACRQGYRKEGADNEDFQRQPPPATPVNAGGDSNLIPAAQRQLAHRGTLDFLVAGTLPATRQIEEQVRQSGGFILQSKIDMLKEETTMEPVNADSVKKIVYFQLQNNMVVRVPEHTLPQFLDFVDSLSHFTTSRILESEDVSLALAGNRLEQQRLNKQVSRRHVTNSNTEPISLEEKETERDAVQMNRLQMTDAVQFSTVHLHFRQPPQVAVQYEVNADAVWARQPGFFKRAGYAFSEGWAKCMDLLVFLVQIWWLIGIVLLCWMGWRKWGRPLTAAPNRKPV